MRMYYPKITKIIEKPKPDKYGRLNGLFVVEKEYLPSKERARVWLTPEEFKLDMMKLLLVKKGLTPRLIEKFEEVVREDQRDSDMENEFG